MHYHEVTIRFATNRPVESAHLDQMKSDFAVDLRHLGLGGAEVAMTRTYTNFETREALTRYKANER